MFVSKDMDAPTLPFPRSFHRYSFAFSVPSLYTDPLGLFVVGPGPGPNVPGNPDPTKMFKYALAGCIGGEVLHYISWFKNGVSSDVNEEAAGAICKCAVAGAMAGIGSELAGPGGAGAGAVMGGVADWCECEEDVKNWLHENMDLNATSDTYFQPITDWWYRN